MTVKIQNRINLKNECGCIVDENELKNAMLWYQKSPTLSNKKIYMHGNYPCVSIGSEKVHVHRLLMQYWLNLKLPFQASVHHINENKLDARKENLSIMINSAHNKNHNEGRVFTKNHKRKISEANKRRKGMKFKKTHNIPISELKDLLGYGFSIKKISELYNCDWTTIKSRIIENPELLETKKSS